MHQKSKWLGHLPLAVGHIIFWCAYLAFEHITHLIYGDNHWYGSLFSSVFMMAATGGLAVWFDHLKTKSNIFGYIGLIAIGLLLFTIWNGLNAVLHGHMTIQQLIDGDWLVWYSGGGYRFLLLLSWIGLYVSGYIYLQKQTQKQQLVTAQHLARDAQLQLLMAQLNPHFLFNVLNSLDVAILERKTDEAHQMVVKLSQFLRTTLEFKFSSKIPLYQELELVNRFIDIEKQRSKQTLHVNCNIDAGSGTAHVPPFILQPLIENAIKFSRTLGGTDAELTITANVNAQQLNIKVINLYDTVEQACVVGTSSGLENVIHRLNLLYGERYSFLTEDQIGQFVVSMTIPFEVKA